ncbi:Inhibitor of carbonic anhydrase [Bienertia sinuspersici]
MVEKVVVEQLSDKLDFQGAFGVSSWGRSRAEGKVWPFVGVYGWTNLEDKYKTWRLIRHLCIATTLPIMFGGDFNEILCMEEKEGGSNVTRRVVENF